MQPMEVETISLFDAPELQGAAAMPGTKIDVVKMMFTGAEATTWQELFSGYNKLHAITFSSGINFTLNLLQMFDSAEIIFGCEEIIPNKIQDIIAHQTVIVNSVREEAGKQNLDLLTKIENHTARFYVARVPSHEKIYLLEASDGKKRVIMGSANMSFSAFSGKQRENICCVDGDDAYDWYLECYQRLKENSTDEIPKTTFETPDLLNNIDEVPIAQTVRLKKALLLEPSGEDSDNVRFVLDAQNIAKKIAPLVDKPDKKSGKILITPEMLIKTRRRIQEDSEKEKNRQEAAPRLVVDVYTAKATLNGVSLDLSPDKEDVKRDVELFIKYMDGYSSFHGDAVGMQYRYYEFANWFFCSPFMATMRDMATRCNQTRMPYPTFGLVYGKSKAGKTSYLETLLKMMIGQKPKMAAPDFTRSSIENLKRTVQGAPIIVDDLTNQRFVQHAIETIKNDDFGTAEHLEYYPAVVISANEDVKVVSSEISRRTVICRAEAGLTNTEVMKSNVVRSVQQKIGTAFYREYLRRMLEIAPDMIAEMMEEESESAPDILARSSQVIIDIFKESIGEALPEYVKSLSLENYFGEQVIGKNAIKTINDAWAASPKAFVVSKKNNELRYNANMPYEAERLMKELPETLEPRKAREWVVMSLDEAKKFFKNDFRRSIFRR